MAIRLLCGPTGWDSCILPLGAVTLEKDSHFEFHSPKAAAATGSTRKQLGTNSTQFIDNIKSINS